MMSAVLTLQVWQVLSIFGFGGVLGIITGLNLDR